ncbi:MAG: serine/threonine protein phosphatase [Proteobacteria bacterium]|nr:serine/threonine protein phosphatase [Pseudomonadota bacterium]MBU4288324.1 serine/threonine protein phosphatase [Pseudomonadota bacterium]MCG2757994.1 serine/threonine protein phosphatase [Desulfobacteraceae bacterium]MCG2821095.1 serine/threonine protein phosphatase [Candidatus Atribacteria bacterium]
MEKIFAIGDIHGCFDKLCELMAKINIDRDNDTLLFLGDYIDRGPDSFDVVEYLIDLKKNFQKIVFLKGNHEEMLEKYLAGKDRLTYLINGGHQTLESYMKRSRMTGSTPIPQEHLDFFESLSFYYQTDNYIFVHAGLRENIPLEMQDYADLLWIREDFVGSDFDFGKRVIFGHTPYAEPLVEPNKIGIDTGAVYGNKLTCIELPEFLFYTA